MNLKSLKESSPREYDWRLALHSLESWESGNVSLYYNYMKSPSTQSMNGKCMPFTESQGCCQESGHSILTTFFFLIVYLQRRRQYHHQGSELTFNWEMSGHRISGSWLGIRRIWGTCVQVGLTLASIMSNDCGGICLFQFVNYYAILDTMTYWQESLIEMKIKRLGIVLGQASHLITFL